MPIEPTAIEQMFDMDWPVLVVLSGLIVERVFTTLKSRGVDIQKLVKQLDELTSQVKEIHDFLPEMKAMRSESKELHNWHDVHDSDGVPRWYCAKSYIHDLSKKVDEMIRTLDKLTRRTQ